MSAPSFGEVDLRLREASGEPQGALILNHGRGADEHDLFLLLEALDPERSLLGVTTGAPYGGIAPGGRQWYVVERGRAGAGRRPPEPGRAVEHLETEVGHGLAPEAIEPARALISAALADGSGVSR